MHKLIILAAICCGIAACQISGTESFVLDNSVCDPPCWQNMTPGQTTKQEVQKIISTLPFVVQSSITSWNPKQTLPQGAPDQMYDEIIYAKFLPKETSGTWITIDIINDKVIKVSLSGDWNLTLENVFEKWDKPQYVLVTKYGDEFAVGFVSPTKGLAFGYTTVGRLWQKSKINPNTMIHSIEFFDPDDYELFLNSRSLSYGELSGKEISERLVPWIGFGDIQKKYPLK